MAIYYCKGCNRCLNLDDEFLYSKNQYFDAGHKGTLSFSEVDKSDFRQKEQVKCFPFFETLNYWGIQRRRTKLMCAACGKSLGFIYKDGPPVDPTIGQFGFGATQMIPRLQRYRLKRDALRIRYKNV
jgi:peptide methionine sulfoxide reductase MsrB